MIQPSKMPSSEYNIKQPRSDSMGYYSALAVVVLTIITFGIAILMPPLSGPWCKTGCFEYPYENIASRFPRDYYWMYPAMLLNLAFVALLVSIYQHAPEEKKSFTLLALLFGTASSVILLVDYFVKLTVVQPSELRGETDGIALLTQYNPHGLFIALEDLGYSLLVLALFCTPPAFSKNTKPENAIRIVFVSGFLSTVLALVIICLLYGLNREYRFEVAVILIAWAMLIVVGILLSRIFKKATQTFSPPKPNIHEQAAYP